MQYSELVVSDEGMFVAGYNGWVTEDKRHVRFQPIIIFVTLISPTNLGG